MQTMLILAALVIAGGAVAGDAPALTEAQRRRVTPIVETVQRELPGVVNISATQVAMISSFGGSPFLGLYDSPFERRKVESNAVGSGAVIHPAGYVLTNAHVIAKASELIVIFSDGRKFPARVVAALPEDDIAVIQVQAPPEERFRAIRLGRSDDLMVGESVIAIGNPLGLKHSVTTGIVSAVGRDLEPIDGVRFENVIQTDAAINLGNSGGPLLNILGEQIGVNSAVRSDAQNVGFAIPIDRVRELLPQMLGVEAQGRLRLGLRFAKFPAPDGHAQVTSVEPNSPAARAGIRPGSRIAAVGGEPTSSLVEVLVALLQQDIAHPFSLSVLHPDNSRHEVRLTIEPIPLPDGKRLLWRRFGLELEEIDEQMAQKIGVRPQAALRVRRVDRNSPAARVGIEAGDLIPQIGGFGVHALRDAALIVENVQPGDRLGFRIVRIHGRSVLHSETYLRAQ